MKKSLIIIAVLLLLSMTAQAAGVATLSQTKTYVRTNDMMKTVIFDLFVEVENTGNKALELGASNYEVYNAAGDAIDAQTIYAFFPPVVEPGEKAYAYATSYLKDLTSEADVADYSVTPVGKSAQKDIVKMDVTSTEIVLPKADALIPMTYIKIIVKNNTDKAVKEVNYTVATFDKEGKLTAVTHRQDGLFVLPGAEFGYLLPLDPQINYADAKDYAATFASAVAFCYGEELK